ncbi:hypothetical protein PIB30_056819 [Stylosanthes scabra]|uniref:Aminotransferase-like plant mobile domain-containing protein n=1 Tax=Stylosanthes scabra TaxID=79078 RepID=A0ABU6UKA8_9FABA|nr:hypothetical protein [Stylosanthes scabra]
MILGLSSHGVPVTGWTGTSIEALKGECMLNFGVQPDDSDIKASSFIKISWIRRVKNSIRLIDEESMNRYVRWVNWVVPNREQRRWKVDDYRRMFDNITNDMFLWTPYDEHRLGPTVVSNDIFTRADLWNALSPLISFECIEWCPTDRVMRQFGLAQGISGEARSLGGNHNECLTGPKNKNWRNEYRDWIGQWLNRVPVWHPNYSPPVGVPLDDYITWHNGNYKAFLELSAFDANQGHHDDTDGPEEEPEQSQQTYYVPQRSPTPVYIPPQQEPMCGSMPPTSSFPYPMFMQGVAPYLSNHMDPHAFNALCGMANEHEMAQQAKVTEENQVEAQQTNQAIPSRLSVDSHFNAPVASGHSATRQSFDSSRSFNRRGIGEDGVRRANTARDIDLNFNASSIQEDEEAARYTRRMDTYHSNSDNTDMDEDEEEDYMVMDADDDDNEGDASDSAAGSSTQKDAGMRYELRTENSRHSPNRFTPSGWLIKGLKKGVSRLYKNVKDRVKKK